MEDKTELEEHFILRLPLKTARKIRKLLHTKPKKIKKMLRFDLDLTNNTGEVHVGRTILQGLLKNIPTIIESYKTYDKVKIFKTADISKVLICSDEVQVASKTLDFPHGLTPPMKNVRRRRFRKTLFNQDQAMEVENIERELWYLLRTDMEASQTSFEIIYEGNKENNNQEVVLFGSVSSDSDENEID